MNENDTLATNENETLLSRNVDVHLTAKSSEMQSSIKNAVDSTNILPPQSELDSMKGDCMRCVDFVYKDERGDERLKLAFKNKVEEAYLEYQKSINEVFGENGGGENKLEFYATTGDGREKRGRESRDRRVNCK